MCGKWCLVQPGIPQQHAHITFIDAFRDTLLSSPHQVFGIDCTGPFGDGILFKGGEWVPGGEYTQRLRVKNVSPKLKKLKYRLPTTKYFSLAYPEVISLSPGTMQVLQQLCTYLW